jgi:hypothetical protein
VSGLPALDSVAEKLARIRRIVEARVGDERWKARLLGELVRAERTLERIRGEYRVDRPELAERLAREAARLATEAARLPKNVEEFHWKLKLFSSHLSASYYDFSSRLRTVRLGYRLYVASTVIAMVLMPIFLPVGFIMLGVYVLGLLISIHAFRARRKLGPLIAAALLPVALFTDVIALRYSIYALTTPAEVARMTVEAGLSTAAAHAILLIILFASTASLAMGFYSLYTIYRHVDAFA